MNEKKEIEKKIIQSNSSNHTSKETVTQKLESNGTTTKKEKKKKLYLSLGINTDRNSRTLNFRYMYIV